eukprot:scaffold121270_cov21-Tisochrysis_lutea.AAC.1
MDAGTVELLEQPGRGCSNRGGEDESDQTGEEDAEKDEPSHATCDALKRFHQRHVLLRGLRAWGQEALAARVRARVAAHRESSGRYGDVEGGKQEPPQYLVRHYPG